MKRHFASTLVAAAMLLWSSGCAGGGDDNLPATVDAKGVLTLDGQPVEGATVSFVQPEGQYSAFSITDRSGRFDLRSFEAKPGAVPGSYLVMVSKTVEVQGAAPAAPTGPDEEEQPKGGAWENALPGKYANPVTSGYKIEIPTTGLTDIKLELSSK